MINKKITIFGLVTIFFVCFVSAVTITSAAIISAKSSTGAQMLEDMINAESARVAELNVRLDTTLGITHTLQKKSNGNDVKLLQQFLRIYGVYPEGLITGYFGPLTERAVKKFQEKESIDSVGIAGPKTRARIVEISRQKRKKNPTIPTVTTVFAAPSTSTSSIPSMSSIAIAAPAIVDAVLATDVADNGAAVAPVMSFASTTQNIYAILLLKNAAQDTKIAYIRYYATYIDSEVSHPSRSGLAYFHFQWSLKPGNNRLPGNYTLVFYLNGKSAKTIQYSIY